MRDQIIAFGIKSSTPQILLEKIICNENFIHTAIDYDNQLRIKSTAIKLDRKINLIHKVYLSFYDYSSENRLPLTDQLKRIDQFFNPLIDKLIIQISSVPTVINFSKKDIINFFKTAAKKYNIKYFFVESYIDGEKQVMELVSNMLFELRSIGLENNIFIGITSYDSPFCRGFSDNMIDFINTKKLYYMPMRIFYGIKKNNQLEKICKNKILHESKFSRFSMAVTSTSKEKHYEELKELSKSISKFKKINKLKKFNYHDQNFIGKNPYGNPYRLTLRSSLISIKRTLKTLFIRILNSIHKELSLKEIKYVIKVLKAGF